MIRMASRVWVLAFVCTAACGNAQVIDVDANWLAVAGKAPYYLDHAGATYRLQTDITADGTAFAVIAANVTLDLNGHTITYNNAEPITVANGSFESDLAGSWNLASAPNASRQAGDFLHNEVHLGNHSLKISVPCEDQAIDSASTITLQPNTAYCCSAMMQRGKRLEIEMYVQLVGQNGEPTRTVSKRTGNPRGIQYHDQIFTTGPKPETYKLRLGIHGASQASGNVYFDDVRVNRYYNYGIAATVKGSTQSFFPDVTRTGNADNFTVRGGTIQQGRDHGRECSAILNHGSSDVTIQEVDMTVCGPLTKVLWSQSGGPTRLVDSTLTSNVLTIRSRDQFDASMVGNNFHGEIANCTFWNGPHTGIRTGTRKPTEVHHCTFQMQNRFTNGFAIGVRGKNSSIHHNTIDNTGIYNGRGIFLEGNATAGMKVYDNTIAVQSLPLNQEYGGALIAYGIQIENADTIEVYNNTVTAVGDQGESSAFRCNNNPNNLYVHHNTFIAGQVAAGVETQCVQFTNLHGELGNRFEDNTFRSNKNWVGATDNCTDVVWRRTTFELAKTPSPDARWWESVIGKNANQKITWQWIDNSYMSDEARATVENGAWRRTGYGQWDPFSDYRVSWTTTLRVTQGTAALAGESIAVRDSRGAEVFSGATDAQGTAVAVLDEFKIEGSGVVNAPATRISLNPYTLASGDSTLTFAADRPRTVELIKQ